MEESFNKANVTVEGSAKLRLHVLASGSKGNCSIIEDARTGSCIAVDAGISWRAFRERCAACGIELAQLGAILITHEHTDHTKGLGVITRGLARAGVHPTVHASSVVHAASSDLCAIQDAIDLRHFKQGVQFALGGMDVLPFRTSHDAAESFGFRFDRDGDALGFMTDTGIVTGEAFEALQGCRILALEANHDPDMLEHGPYPRYLKVRIASEHGHLSNVQSAELLEKLLDDCVESVIGMHVSQNNNTYRLPKDALIAALKRNGHPAQAFVGFQDRPLSV